MARKIKIRQAGGSYAATLPKDAAARLGVRAGDAVYAVETADGLLLTPYDPEFDREVEAFEQVRRQFRNALRKLAK